MRIRSSENPGKPSLACFEPTAILAAGLQKHLCKGRAIRIH